MNIGIEYLHKNILVMLQNKNMVISPPTTDQ